MWIEQLSYKNTPRESENIDYIITELVSVAC